MSRVTVYGADWCHDTISTRRQLDKLNVPYAYRDIDKDPTALTFVADHNGGKRKLPTVDVGGEILSVPDESELDQVLRGQGIVQ